MTTPKISVVMPVYNVENYLSQCLDSLIKQTLKEFEIICVDDSSTDHSLEILKDYQKKDARIIILEQKKSNAGAARNRGLKAANGTYLIFLDSDDYFMPNMLESCWNVMEREQSDMVIFAASQLNMKDLTIKPMPWSLRIENCPTQRPFNPIDMAPYIFNSFQNWPWNKAFRRSFILDNGILFQEIPRTNDMAFVCSALVLASKISIIEEAFTIYRIGTGTSLQSTNEYSPLSFWEAYKETKTRLMNYHLYKQYEQSYLNTVLSGMIYNLKSVKSEKAYNQILNLIVNEIDPEMEFQKYPPSYYYDQNRYKDYLKALNTYNNKVSTVTKKLTLNHSKIAGGIRCIQDHGVLYTINYVKKRVYRHLKR